MYYYHSAKLRIFWGDRYFHIHILYIILNYNRMSASQRDNINYPNNSTHNSNYQTPGVWVERVDVIRHVVVMTCLPDITKSQILKNNDRPYRRSGEVRRRPTTLFQSYSSGKNLLHIQSQNTVGNLEMGRPI